MHRSTRKRPGFTLVELLATMAVGSAMMGIAVGVLYLLLGMERDGRRELRCRDTVARLSRQFRDDVHAAVDLQQVPNGKTWELKLSDGRTVRYESSAEELVRTERAGDKRISQEGFFLGPDVAVSIEAASDEVGPLVRLKIVPAGEPGAEERVPEAHIDAVLGRDRRLAEPREATP